MLLPAVESVPQVLCPNPYPTNCRYSIDQHTPLSTKGGTRKTGPNSTPCDGSKVYWNPLLLSLAVNNRGCRGNWISIPIPILYLPKNLWESPQNLQSIPAAALKLIVKISQHFTKLPVVTGKSIWYLFDSQCLMARIFAHPCSNRFGHCKTVLAATLRGSRPGVQSASLIMTSLMTS